MRLEQIDHLIAIQAKIFGIGSYEAYGVNPAWEFFEFGVFYGLYLRGLNTEGDFNIRNRALIMQPGAAENFPDG